MQRINYIIIILILSLPSCRIVDWGKCNFYQGESVTQPYIATAQRYLRSIVVYDQFTTRAMFDGLWLSDTVRTAYVNLHVMKTGTSKEAHQALLRTEQETEKRFIDFYVLSLFEVPLNEPQSAWSVFLEADNFQLLPISVIKVDLSYEYKMFFGKRFTRFKNAYLVRFDAFEEGYEPRLLRLHFYTAHRKQELQWRLDEQGNLIDEPSCIEVKRREKRRE